MDEEQGRAWLVHGETALFWESWGEHLGLLRARIRGSLHLLGFEAGTIAMGLILVLIQPCPTFQPH